MSILHRPGGAGPRSAGPLSGAARAMSDTVVAWFDRAAFARIPVLAGVSLRRIDSAPRRAWSFRVARDAGELARHAPEWRKLCETEHASCFARPEWVLPYVKAFEPSVLVALAYEGDRLAGVFPCRQSQHRFGRVLSTLEGEHVPELALVLSDDRERLLSSFVEWAFDCGYSELRFPRVSLDGPLHRALERAFAEPSTMFYERVDRWQHHTDVKGDFSSSLGARSKNFRKQVARAQRAARDLGLTVEVLADRGSIESALPDLVRISEASWQGRAGTGTFANATYRACYAEAALGLADAGLVRLIVCRRRGVAIGLILHLIESDRLVALKSEFDEAEGACMAGWQIAAAAFDEAHALGLEAVTSGCFVTDFKERWTTHRSPCCEITAFAPSVAGAISFAFPYLAKELVKRASGRASVARCLPLLDWSRAPPIDSERQADPS
jgi:CelD/BcsL family acetyltransferase involved in cellulose biosynthesis